MKISSPPSLKGKPFLDLNELFSPVTTDIGKDDFEYIKKIITELLPIDSKDWRRGYRIPGSKEDGYSSIYINEFCHTKNDDKVFSHIHPSLNTVNAIFEYAVKIFGDRDLLGERKFNSDGKKDDFFTFDTYLRIAKRRIDIGSGIFQFLETNEFLTGDHDLNDFVLAIYSANRLQWLLTDFACQAYSITNTLLYDTLGPESTKYILELTDCPIIVCSKDKLPKILALKLQLPKLIGVVSIDNCSEFEQKFYDAGIKLINFDTLEQIGKSHPRKVNPPTPKDVMTISFTSGTTGIPKGVILTHELMAALLTFNAIHMIKPQPENLKHFVFSFLPLAHIFERSIMCVYMIAGVSVGFPTLDDSPLTLIDNLKILKPSLLVGVPRLFNRLESGIRAKVEASGLLSRIVNGKIARQELKDDEKAESFFADRFVIKKLRQAVGFDNMNICITGSAPINPSTVKFLKLALGIGFSQGYGATEIGGGCMISATLERNPGSCGSVGAATQLKLKNLPELNYLVDKNGEELDEPLGEMLMRSPQLFSGYYKNESATKEAFDEDGWYHTGDVCRIDKEGRVHLIDRVKNFFKLSQGEFIVPEKIENTYLSSNPILSQLYVHGDPTKTHLVGIVGITQVILEQILQSNNHKIPKAQDEILKLVNTTPVKKIILQMLNGNETILKNLTGFEKIQNIHIDIEPLKIEDDVITPTFKVKRNVAKVFFQKIINALYEEGKLVTSALKL